MYLCYSGMMDLARTGRILKVLQDKDNKDKGMFDKSLVAWISPLQIST